MDLQNLKEHHEELLSFMENNGYSSTYIRRFREEINRILTILVNTHTNEAEFAGEKVL